MNCKDPELYFHRGSIYLILEEYSKAIADFKKAEALDPFNYEYDRRIAMGYAMMGIIDKAKKHIKAIELKQDQIKRNYNELGIQALSTGSYSEAVSHFNHFIETDPSLGIGYQNRGIAFFEIGNGKEALNDFDQAITLDPLNADFYQLRAMALMTLPAEDELQKKAYLKEAQINFTEALKLNPNDSKIYQNLAAFYSLNDNLDAALECYIKALTLNSKEEQFPILKNLILIHFEREEYEKALLYCEKARPIKHNDGEIYFIQGICAFETNQFEQAIDYFHYALHSGYAGNNLYLYLAKTFFCLQQFDKALKEASKGIEIDSFNLECYKLRGLIFLSLHREVEASKDFSKALQLASEFSLHKENQIDKLASLQAEMLYSNHDLITSLNEYFQSSIESKEGFLIKKLREIDLDAFEKGLVFGLIEGGKETLKELGPFFAHLVFHPIDTTEEIVTAVKFLLSKMMEEEWDTVCEMLVPELKELFSTWDKIEDYHKGKLTGLFIGKNGMAALSIFGAAKTFSKLKHIVVGVPQNKFACTLKRAKIEAIPLPASELPCLPSAKIHEWQIPYTKGVLSESPFMNGASLIRLTSEPQHNKILLEAKAIHHLNALGNAHPTWEAFESSVLSKHNELSTNLRVIPPPIINTEVTQIGSKGGRIEIAFNDKGEVAIARAIKSGRILIRNNNTKKHIMQPKHAWDKLIKLTGDIEEDCKKLVKLLEDSQIYLEKYQIGPSRNFKGFIRYDHQMKINGYEVKVIFNKNIETNELFLNDAWIITE